MNITDSININPNCIELHSEVISCQADAVDDDENVTLFAPPPNEECRRLRDMCYLATAYSANLGGTGVITGTGPNLVMKASMEK